MFVGLYSCQTETDSFDQIATEQIEISEKSSHSVIVHAHFGRKSRNCFGIGICDACLFCCPHCSVVLLNVPTPHHNESITNPIVDLYLPNPIEEYESGEDTTLYIDETIIIEDSDEYEIRIIEGEYEYESEMGEYGGYKIQVFISPIE